VTTPRLPRPPLAHRLRQLRRADGGFELLEFAMVVPVFLFLVFAMIFTLMDAGAYIALTHGALQGVRYESIPTDPIAGTYPTNTAVANVVAASTPFFHNGQCSTTTSGGAAENQPVSVSVSCTYLNPLGSALGGLGALVARLAGASSSSSSATGSQVTLSVTATARSE
jgi:Flp pilus assembly protein TadG